MWGKIVSLLLVAGALPPLAWPEGMQQKLQKKGMRYVTKLLFVCLVSTGGLLISFAWQQEGWIPKAIGVAGVIILLKSLLFLRSKIGQIMAEKLTNMPPLFLRVYAVCQIAVGVGLYLFTKSNSQPL
jgi:hypothetical protein